MENKTPTTKLPKKQTTKKARTKKQRNRSTSTGVDISIIALPLKDEVWIGADGKKWRDLSVDSRSQTGLFWLRERKRDKTYYLIVSTVGGHILKKEVTKEEAKALFSIMHDKIQYESAFPKRQKKQEDKKEHEEKLEGADENS